jgi:hypothetical protein
MRPLRYLNGRTPLQFQLRQDNQVGNRIRIVQATPVAGPFKPVF